MTGVMSQTQSHALGQYCFFQLLMSTISTIYL